LSGPDQNQIRVWTGSGRNSEFSYEIGYLKKLKIEFENSKNSQKFKKIEKNEKNRKIQKILKIENSKM